MKKLLTIAIGLIFCATMSAQLPINAGGTWATARTTINTNFTRVYDSLAAHNTKLLGKLMLTDTAAMLLPYLRTVTISDISATGTPSSSTYLRGDGTWATPAGGSGGEMIYPGAGIALSTGSAWGTSITNNSALWNTAIQPTDTAMMLVPYARHAEVRIIVSDSLRAALDGAETGVALADSNVYAGGYATPTFVDTQIAASGGGADSSIYVTVTRLTDSLNVMRSLINDLIAAVEASGLDLTAPTIDSLEIGRFADDTIRVWWSEPMIEDSIPPVSTFYLTEDDEEMGIASIYFENDSIMGIVLDSAAVYGATYLLDYTRSFPRLQDTAYNSAANFTNKSVTNYMTEPVVEWDDGSIVNNGGFDSDAYWTTSAASWSIADGVASFDRSGTGILRQGASRMATAIEASTYYTITWNVSGLTSGATNLSIQDSTASTSYRALASENGSFEIGFLTPASIGVGGIGLRASASSGSAFDLDSVKIIPSPNHVSNGTFASATGWTTGDYWSIADGVATYDKVSTGAMSQSEEDLNVVIEPNKKYRIIFDLVVEEAGTAQIGFYDSSNTVAYSTVQARVDGTIVINFTAPADIGSGGLAIRASGTSTHPFTIDNLRIVRFDPE